MPLYWTGLGEAPVCVSCGDLPADAPALECRDCINERRAVVEQTLERLARAQMFARTWGRAAVERELDRQRGTR
jgi:hypothetical protein